MSISFELCACLFLIWSGVVAHGLSTLSQNVGVITVRLFVTMSSLCFVFLLGIFAGAMVSMVSMLPLISLLYDPLPHWGYDLVEFFSLIAGNLFVWFSWRWWLKEKRMSHVDSSTFVGVGQVRRRSAKPNSVFQRKFH